MLFYDSNAGGICVNITGVLRLATLEVLFNIYLADKAILCLLISRELFYHLVYSFQVSLSF